jgi:predicted alpha/beta-hydrolase family hydrolase
VDIATSDGIAHAGLTEPTAQPPAIRVPGAGQAWDGRPAFLFVLTHGAGGGVEAPDLCAARDAALRLGGAVAMVTQPYRAKGRRAPGAAARQDAAWVEIITALRETALRETAGALHAAGGLGIPLIQGGRSNGARVACRTARAVDARAVVALAFPLHPPGRPERSRLAELRETGTDVLVVNGDRDPFGVPGRADATRVVVLAGESHALSRRPEAVADAVGSWLRDLLAAAR